MEKVYKVLLEEDGPNLAPKEEWVDITQECTVSLVPNYEGTPQVHLLISLEHMGKRIQYFGLNRRKSMPTSDYRIEPDGETAEGTQWFKVFHKQAN